MAEDWAADVKKYVPDADDDIIAGIVRYCGIALQKRDSSLVAMSDPTETGRVRENFLRKKLGLTDADAVLDAAIAAVDDLMKDDRTKNRVTVYYLLAEKFGKLELFRKKSSKGTKSGAAVGAASTSDAMALAGDDLPSEDGRIGDDKADAIGLGAGASPVGFDHPTGSSEADASGGPGWLLWLLLSFAALFLIWWFLLR